MDESHQPEIHIVGGGVSGLVAAQVLEKNGHAPIIFEAGSRIGGRVKTDEYEGYQLDHGFQVLLNAYPKAKEYLDYSKLELQPLLPGAVIFQKGKSVTIGDPLRNSDFLLSSLFSSIGNFSDKLKILLLNQRLKKKSFDKIFEDSEKSTLQYLNELGLSTKIINQFFKPFFSGIYLEPDLQTSSRMFEYVYKLFGEGLAVIPKSGMEAIPQQLSEKLTKTKIVLNSPVKEIVGNKVVLASGNEVKSDFTIVSSQAEQLIPNYSSSLKWKSCDCLYYTTPIRKIAKPIIGLSGNVNTIINNIFYPTSIETNQKGDKELLSVTVVKNHKLKEQDLFQKIGEELETVFGITDFQLLKRYHIRYALPDISNIKYHHDPSESLINDHIAIAGDHVLNGSLNAAMIAGEKAALAAIDQLRK